MQKKKRIIAIVGPTASGKSGLAVKLAKTFNGEVISADSRQVYKGLEIGSGLIEGRWAKSSKIQHKTKSFYIAKGIPHHCVNYISPKKRGTVVDFQKCARQAIDDIHTRGNIPFLVGGTGLYVDAVIENVSFPAIPPNAALRKKLDRFSAEKLFAMLTQKDPRRAATIDAHNKRRLIRALEIITATKKPISNSNSNDYEKLRPPENVVVTIGIKKEKKELQNAIAKRARAMLKKGLVAETRRLRTQGLSWKRIAEFGFEYRLPALFLQKKISRKKLGDQLIQEHLRYAKRQMTWWRRNKNIHWVSSFSEARISLTKVLK